MSNRLATPDQLDVHTTPVKRRGLLIVVSSPSGGGKGTLLRRALKILPDVSYSVSFTTRAPRDGEINGREYFFVNEDKFRSMEGAGEFLESAVVHGKLYGTARAQVEKELREGRDIMLEIDVQGADNVRRLVPEAILVFVLPPSFSILRERLKARNSESAAEQELRLENARTEVEAYKRSDYVIINDDADRAANQLAAVIFAERARRERQEISALEVIKTFTDECDGDLK